MPNGLISLRSVLSASRPLWLCCPFKRKRGEVADRRFSPMFAAFLLELRPYCSCGEGEVNVAKFPLAFRADFCPRGW